MTWIVYRGKEDPPEHVLVADSMALAFKSVLDNPREVIVQRAGEPMGVVAFKHDIRVFASLQQALDYRRIPLPEDQAAGGEIDLAG
jgi:hypothetical protein